MDVLMTNALLFSYSIATFLILMRFCSSIFQVRERDNKRHYLLLACVIVLASLSNIFIDNFVMSLLRGVVYYISLIMIIYEAKIHIKLSAAMYFFVFSLVSELIAALLLSKVYVGLVQGAREHSIYMFVGGLTSKIILILIVEVVVRLWSRKASKVSISAWGLIVSIPLISLLLSLTVVYKPIINGSFSSDTIVICFSILYINLVSFYLFDQIVKQVDENNHFRFRETMLMQQEGQYKSIIASYDEIRKVRHDMNLHLTTLDGYIRHREMDKAKSYIARLNNQMDVSEKGIISTNVVVDALINNGKEIMNKENIIFECDLAIPQYLNVDDMDLSSVLGNMLTNAIEANVRGNLEDKRIHLHMRYKNKCLFIKMRNTYDTTSIKKRGLKFLSSKKNRPESHGIGLFNINETVNKYGGAFQIEEKEDIFQVMIMLPEKLG